MGGWVDRWMGGRVGPLMWRSALLLTGFAVLETWSFENMSRSRRPRASRRTDVMWCLGVNRA